MTSIYKAGYGEIGEFLGRLDRAGLTLELLRRVNRDASLADRIARACEHDVTETGATATTGTNPFALPVETLLTRLEQASYAWGWGIDLGRLRETAPPLPAGRLAFLSFRIRFGQGKKGVEQTANAHIKEIFRVHGERDVGRFGLLRTDKKHLRLLVGNGTHKPVVEWCVIDLDAHRKRQSVTAVRGPKSIADEGLVLTWLYPEYPQSINNGENPAYFLGGYELHLPPDVDDDPWSSVPVVSRDLDAGVVNLCVGWRSDDDSDAAVSSLRE